MSFVLRLSFGSACLGAGFVAAAGGAALLPSSFLLGPACGVGFPFGFRWRFAFAPAAAGGGLPWAGAVPDDAAALLLLKDISLASLNWLSACERECAFACVVRVEQQRQLTN